MRSSASGTADVGHEKKRKDFVIETHQRAAGRGRTAGIVVGDRR
jgi:hypothetical protein